eukprot:gb/GECH01000309.1/.p1 GENE.gb/GECH01000309.1/~~gb/GECH01000309.1/.p1  ORF type:complete len:161 (+),score=40.39 gb/GECH01000309.1/:1-483(+)
MDLPEGWEIRRSRTYEGRVYFVNTSTGKSQWEMPTTPAMNNDSNNRNTPTEVRASHILAKHTNSRRPSSWRQKTITRSHEEAHQMISEFLRDIQNGSATFESIAEKYSDCNSAKRQGDLGTFGKGKMQKPFEDAAFSLNIGEISNPFDTASGVHIVKRTG